MSSDEEFFAQMKVHLDDILRNLPNREGFCDGGGGYPVGSLLTDLMARYPDPGDKERARKSLIFVQNQAPFKLTKKDSKVAVCLMQSMSASPQNAASARDFAGVTETALTDVTTEILEEKITKRPWPPTEPERFAEVRAVLVAHMESSPTTTAADIQAEFARVGEKRIKEILDTLVALGIAQEIGGKYSHMT